MNKTVTIYGAGYVGLVTGACFAELGHQVLIIDKQVEKIADLARGISPIFEPGLEALLVRHLASGRLEFGTDLKHGAEHGLLQVIAVGTPSMADGAANLEHVFAVARSIAEYVSDYRVIVTKSTVPVGTSLQVKELITAVMRERGVHFELDVASNPEFLKQGAAIADFMKPDRIIIGVENDRANKQLRELYAELDDNSQRIITMDLSSAELTKYAANAYLATRISFMNEMSQLAEHFSADIDMVRRGLGSDQRIGQHFLMAGCGFGGSCFPKDVRALLNMAEQGGFSLPLIAAIEVVNQRQKQELFRKISGYFAGNIAGKTVALWGLAFKPNTDDMREASSCVLIDDLLAAGAKVRAYDPAAAKQAQQLYGEQPQFQLCHQANDVFSDADVLAIVTEWEEFKHPDFALIRDTLRHPVIFDGRNIYDPKLLTTHGLHYYAIGHGER